MATWCRPTSTSTSRRLRDEDGTLRLMGCAVDVTDHVNARRVRDDFLSIASHELKTPLTTLRLQIDGLTRLLSKAAAPTPAEVPPRLDVIRRQILRLERLVNELLDVSRIAAGKLPMTPEEVEPGGAGQRKWSSARTSSRWSGGP